MTVFQWLIERGQPEGEERPVWLEHSGYHVAAEKRWTTNANESAMFPDRETAEDWIAEQGLTARAVEHGFMADERADTPSDTMSAWGVNQWREAWIEARKESIRWQRNYRLLLESMLSIQGQIKALFADATKQVNEIDEALGGAVGSLDFGPVEVVVNDNRYVREETLFAAMRELDDLREANRLRDSQMKAAE
jgi:hypothetical protein